MAAGINSQQPVAREAKAKKWEELINPSYTPQAEMIAIATTFLDLVNLRLDYVKAYNSESHYLSYKYLARRWVKKWGDLMCGEITPAMVQQFLLERRKISAYTANKDLRNFRATINFGIKKKFISNDPTEGIEFFPVEKKIKYIIITTSELESISIHLITICFFSFSYPSVINERTNPNI